MGTCCGCCGYSNDEHEEPLRIRTNPGPRLHRRCTDVPCCILFLAVLACTAVLVDYLGEKGDLRLIDHGRDHAGDLCGLGSQASRPYAFYPDLETDFKKDPTLRRHYGVCVDSCPKVGQSVPDSGTSARAASWLVLQPSFPVFQRCVPYQQPVDSGTTALCASPACSPPAAGVAPTAPQQVCGLARDGTDKFWLLEPPDASIQDGWRGGGADEALIQARTSMAATAASSGAAAGCAQRVKRQAEVSVLPLDEGLPNLLLASVTSPAYTFGNAVADNLGLVLGLGLGGALVLSVAIMLMFPLCAPPVLILLLLVVFFTLVAADYVLFVQAGIATGRTGERFTQFLASLDINVPPGAESLLTQAGDESSGQLCAIGGCCLAVAIALLACLLLSMARQFKILIALLKEAGNMIRVVPSLLALPIFLLASLAVFFGLFLVAFLGLATASQDEVQETKRVDDERTKAHWDLPPANR
ncbi:unnamed protein product [Effrenium voratum]|uniref:Choline transporter-like protein n=1 Tax=Effrenium voratum TaxID=2562239 RepID=A0AA36NAD2_9DINO|nr:unnamed protein product [Effrenium voratum]